MPDDADLPTTEHRRLEESKRHERHWARWGPYLSERAWGTVREDYSADGDAWSYFPHDHARSRAYRWNDDGLLGFSDRHGRICLALALWNGRDAILKERLFGLTGPEGNHGEDVKEVWFHLDALPSHAYSKALYKYPHAAFPYEDLVAENARRGKDDPEYELLDTGVFGEDRYWDVVIEWAKGDDPEDILLQITATNRGPEPAELHLIPQVWFRNTWSWTPGVERPALRAGEGGSVELKEPYYGERTVVFPPEATLLFTENETNAARLSPQRACSASA